MSSYLSRLNLYILNQILPIFCFSSAILTGVGVSIGTLSDLGNKIFEFDLPIYIALQVFLYKIPEYFTYALPTAILLSTLIAFGSLSRHSEILAMFSCGVNMYRIFAPSIALSFIITGITFGVNEGIVPAANYQANIIQNKFINYTTSDSSKLIVYPEYAAEGLKSLLYAENYHDQKAENIVVLYWSNQVLDKIVMASKGRWNSKQQLWYLSDSQVYQLDPRGKLKLQTNSIESYLNYSPLPVTIANLKRQPEDMSIAQALEYIDLLELTGDRQQLKLFKIRTHQKIAFPFVCIIFALVGSVLGSQYNSLSKTHCFGICLLIVFFYYTACFLTEALATVNFLPITIAAWLPNFLGLLIGRHLLINLNQ